MLLVGPCDRMDCAYLYVLHTFPYFLYFQWCPIFTKNKNHILYITFIKYK